jgi:hypothetical protein
MKKEKFNIIKNASHSTNSIHAAFGNIKNSNFTTYKYWHSKKIHGFSLQESFNTILMLIQRVFNLLSGYTNVK